MTRTIAAISSSAMTRVGANTVAVDVWLHESTSVLLLVGFSVVGFSVVGFTVLLWGWHKTPATSTWFKDAIFSSSDRGSWRVQDRMCCSVPVQWMLLKCTGFLGLPYWEFLTTLTSVHGENMHTKDRSMCIGLPDFSWFETHFNLCGKFTDSTKKTLISYLPKTILLIYISMYCI